MEIDLFVQSMDKNLHGEEDPLHYQFSIDPQMMKGILCHPNQK